MPAHKMVYNEWLTLKNRMLRKVAPLDTTSLTKTDDSSYDTITEFINEQCKNYGDELASKSNFETQKSTVLSDNWYQSLWEGLKVHTKIYVFLLWITQFL